MKLIKCSEFPYLTVKVSHSGGHAQKEHFHDYLSLGFVLKGKTSVKMGDQKYHLEKDNLLIIPPFFKHLCIPDQPQNFSFLNIYLDSFWLKEVFSLNTDQLIPKIFPIGIDQKREILNFVSLLEEKDDRLGIQNRAVLLIESFFEWFDFEVFESVVVNPYQVERAKSLMEKRLGERITLDEIAHHAGADKYHLIRMFNQELKMTPHQYLINLRIQRAQKIMMENHPLVEVALECGFTDESHLSRSFKQLTGFTPGEYRKQINQ